MAALILMVIMLAGIGLVMAVVAGANGLAAPIEEEALQEQWKKNSKALGICSLLFAGVFLICMYQNLVSYTYTICVVCFLVCMRYVYQKLELTLGKQEIFCGIFMILVSASTAFTDSWVIQSCNHLMVLLGMLLFTLLGYGQREERQWLVWIRSILILFCEWMISAFAVFGHMRQWRSTKESGKNTKYILLGVACGIPMVLMVIGLLSSADPIFAHWFSNIFRLNWLWSVIQYIIMFFVGFLGFYGIAYGGLRALGRKIPLQEKKFEPVVAITAAIMILMVYMVFVYVQIRYLFLGGVWSLPKGFTYAEYARQGFFQLLFVSILNYIMVLGVLTFFRESKALKVVMTGICLCTYIMIASSFYRMLLYVKMYDLTFLRILVLYFLIGLAILFFWLMIAMYREQIHFLRNTVVTVAVCYLIFAFARPDYWVATYNYSVNGNFSKEDWCTMAEELSLDAAPVLLAHTPWESSEIEKYREEEQDSQKEYGEEDDYIEYGTEGYYEYIYKDYISQIHEKQEKLSIRKFNFAVYQAAKAAENK